MNRKFLAALMAAGALLPFAAQAQDRHDRGGWRGGGDRGQSAAPSASPAPTPAPTPSFQGYRRGGNGVEGAPQNSGWQGQNRGQWQRPQQPQQQVQAAPQPQAPVQAQPQPNAGGRNNAWGGNGGNGWNRGDGRGGQPQQAQQSQPQPNAGGRNGSSGGNNGWNRGDGRNGQPQQAQQAPNQNGRPNPDWARGRDRDGGRDGNWQRNQQQDPRTAPVTQRGGRNNWNENRGWQNGRDGGGWRNDREFRNWNRDWRQDNRYDWQRYRYQNRNAYHLPRYYAPRGWNYGYRRFSVGIYLDSFLFAQNYWIGDPGYYRLPPVYEPYRWVRYYNDALLVDTYSGEVVDVIYDIFW